VDSVVEGVLGGICKMARIIVEVGNYTGVALCRPFHGLYMLYGMNACGCE